MAVIYHAQEGGQSPGTGGAQFHFMLGVFQSLAGVCEDLPSRKGPRASVTALGAVHCCLFRMATQEPSAELGLSLLSAGGSWRA